MGQEQSLGRMINKFLSNMDVFMFVFMHVRVHKLNTITKRTLPMKFKIVS